MNTPSQPNNSLPTNSPTTVSLAQTEPTNYPPAELRNDYPNSLHANSSGRYAVEESSGLDFTHVFSILRRRWKIMAVLFLAVIIVSTYINSLQVPVYESTAIMEISTAGDSTSSAIQGMAGLEGLMGGSSSKGSLATQLVIIQGAELRGRAIKRLTPENQKRVGEITGFFTEFLPDTSLLAVRVQSPNASLSADYANAVCTEFIDSSLVKNRKRSLGAIGYIQEQLSNVTRKLIDAQTRLTAYKKETGIFSVDAQAMGLSTRLGTVKEALEDANAEKAATTARLAAARRMLTTVPQGKIVPSEIRPNEQVTQLQARLVELDIQRSTALEEFTPDSYRVKSIDAQILATKKRIATLSKNIVGTYIEDPRRLPLEQEVALSESTLKSLEAKITALQNQSATAEVDYKKLPDQEYKFLSLAAEVDSLSRSAGALSEKLNQIKLTANAEVADGNLQTAAKPSGAPQRSNKTRQLLSSLAFAIMAALGAALLWDMLDNRIYSDDDVQRATGIPVLAQIPVEKNHENRLVINSGQKMSPVLESFRMLRSNIAFSGADRPIRSIIVTSSLPNEGKSTTALNLATTAALGGETVIIVDLDLRRPTLHSLLGTNNTPGFVNVVLGNNTLEEVIQETSVEGLRVVTCGSVPPNPFKILNSDATRQLIQRLTQMADFVVIDTPPLLGLADARVIASFVDGSVMVVACEETNRRDASRASDLLHSSNGEIIGSILTKVPHTNGGYSDYHTYRNYSAIEEGNSSHS